VILKGVSVIISTFSIDRANHVASCIKSLRKQTLPPDEIILVLDPDEALLEFYKSCMPHDVKIVVSEGYGLSYARNAGVKSAKGEIVAFIDDDAVADDRWLENLVKSYDDPLVVGVGGLIKPIWESSRPIWFPEELDWIVGCSYKGLPKNKAYVRNPIGCNMSFRKDVFGKVGYFRADIGRFKNKPSAGEEAELTLRIFERIPGSKILYDPATVIYHRVPKARANLKYVVRRSFYEGFSKALILAHKSNPLKAMSSEGLYLKYLLQNTIPSKLKNLRKFENICQLMSLVISIFSTFVGYLLGQLEGTIAAER
jgi:glycosyltransferase involved in cell wall biosynthesis